MSALLIAILLLALIFGGVGLFVEGLFWLVVIAVALFIVGGIMGFSGRRSRAA